nr:unnamed protein product [Digitaria exilis]
MNKQQQYRQSGIQHPATSSTAASQQCVREPDGLGGASAKGARGAWTLDLAPDGPAAVLPARAGLEPGGGAAEG